MTETTARFRCFSVTYQDVGLGEMACDVRLWPVHRGSPENARFFYATPAGEINLQLVSQATASQFVPGREYYVLFRPAGQP